MNLRLRAQKEKASRTRRRFYLAGMKLVDGVESHGVHVIVHKGKSHRHRNDSESGETDCGIADQSVGLQWNTV